MGVPAFFRWLSRKYPSVIVHCIEEKPQDVNGQKIPFDSSKPNPNGVEFDNLYLDMNGIIHPCTHPEDKPAPKDEDEMMVAIFECIDRLFRIVRPRKLLYMAIDGVAPRAKMNQQRSRRFRASKETAEKIAEVNKIREKLLADGCILPPEKEKGSHFDSNCITPGTPFMARLSACLHYYVHERLNNDPGWKGIKVILSDANVPGEGEHKIMDYIRKQRAQPDHDPNTQHCLCGADADLIMLGLATHEPNFTIIREEFKPNQARPCDVCGQMGHEMKECVGLDVAPNPDSVVTFGSEVEFIFVRLSVLREYLEKELAMPNLPFEYSFERALDDWVFMCFFVGNDFLPHLPSLEIREGAVDRLVNLYKKTVYKTQGFLTDSGDVKLERVQLIMQDLGLMEDEIFKKRQQTETMFKARNKAKQRRERQMKMAVQNSRQAPSFIPGGQFAPQGLGGGGGGHMAPVQNARQEAYQMRVNAMQNQNAQLRQEENGQGGGRGTKRNFDQMKAESSDEEEDNDEVRLWEDGFKDRYYESKFDVPKTDVPFRRMVGHEYVLGLCWVLKYYYQGCRSWKWYFPFHYAPFASDFIQIAEIDTTFETGTQPFKPLEQLMSVFPAASSSHVPPAWADLMSNPDSQIIDFYPEDFKIDLNGKKFAWQGVALLPFVDETRLHRALAPYYGKLSTEEILRNVRGDDRIYIGSDNEMYSLLKGLYTGKKKDVETEVMNQGMRGRVLLSQDNVNQGGSLVSPVRGLEVVRSNTVYCMKFRDPNYGENFKYPAIRLEGAIEPARVLKPGDLPVSQNQGWRPQTGMAPRHNQASVGQAGHRMVNHYTPRDQSNGRTGGQGQFSAVPPPLMPQYSQGGRFHQGSSSNNYQNQSRGQYGQQGNSGGGSWHSGASRGPSSAGSGNWRGGGYRSGGGGGGGGYNSHDDRGSGGYRGSQHSSGGGYESRGGGGYRGGHQSSNRGSSRYQPNSSNQQSGGPRPPSHYQRTHQGGGRY
uniref:5'-3' exoribonuclease n=1 Tax=Cacopsylla melanoneura TaxID=428564 RepID=A0A8D8TWE9_9HEMI